MKKAILFFAIVSLLMACGSKSKNPDPMLMVQQMTIDSMNAANAKQRTIDSMKLINQKHEENITQKSSTSTVSQKKKGWNSTEKGAVIGAAVGIASGAIIDKKDRGAGAVIGGVSGAAVGAGTGAIIDSKKKP
jgi:hypothetical protein